MRKEISNYRLVFIMIAVVFLCAGIDKKTQNALKVQHILKKIERLQTRPHEKDQTADVSQAELNDYIAFRLARESNTAIRRLNVKLMEKNNVSGTTRLDAASIGLGVLFGDVLMIEFKGRVQSRNGLARMDWDSVKLNGRVVDPETLDTVIRAAAMANGTKARSIRDWYEMPKGVKRVALHHQKATLLY